MTKFLRGGRFGVFVFNMILEHRVAVLSGYDSVNPIVVREVQWQVGLDELCSVVHLACVREGQMAWVVGREWVVDELERSLPLDVGRSIRAYKAEERIQRSKAAEQSIAETISRLRSGVLDKVATTFPEFRIYPSDPEHTGAKEVQLRKSVGNRKIGGIALVSHSTSG